MIRAEYPRGRLTAKIDSGLNAAGPKRAEGTPRRRRRRYRRAIGEGNRLKPVADSLQSARKRI